MEPPKHFFTSEDGSITVPAIPPGSMSGKDDPDEYFERLVKDMKEYKWREDDALLAAYPKNGTHFMWEIMMMLLRGSADYIKESKVVCMFDTVPLTKCDEVFPSPRVLNTHLRLDVLPKEFQGRKTVWMIRNPKDTALSGYHHICKAMAHMMPDSSEYSQLASLSFSQFLQTSLLNKDQPFGSYFDYVDYMWTLKDQPHILLIYFEDLKMNPVETIERVNEFLGVNRSRELVEQIAEATSFSKMKEGKETSMDGPGNVIGLDPELKGSAKHLYRKGEIGSWKEEFTVADNELFDSVLEKWAGGKEIPFKYQ